MKFYRPIGGHRKALLPTLKEHMDEDLILMDTEENMHPAFWQELSNAEVIAAAAAGAVIMIGTDLRDLSGNRIWVKDPAWEKWKRKRAAAEA